MRIKLHCFSTCIFILSSPDPYKEFVDIEIGFNKFHVHQFQAQTRPGVDKVKPKVWFKSSDEIDYGKAMGIRT